MKVAVCITGRLNFLPITFKNIQERVLNQLGDDVDIFIYSSSSLSKGVLKSEENTKQITEEFVKKYINYKEICLTADKNLSIKNDIRVSQWGAGKEKYLQMIYALMKCNEMIKKHSKCYDFILRLRVDVLFVSDIPHISTYSKNAITMPDFHNERGGNPPTDKKEFYHKQQYYPNIDGRTIHDRFAIGPPKLMNKLLDQFNLLPRQDNKLLIFVNCEHLLLNYLKWHKLSWENGNIIRNKNIVFLRLRKKNGKIFIMPTDCGESRNSADNKYAVPINKYFPKWKSMKLKDF